MKPADRPPLLRYMFRLFFLQALWNYRNLQGTGFLFALIPQIKKHVGESGREPIRYHGFFNAHPYLASLAVGATLRREADGSPDQQSIQDFHNRLAGPLGLMGDTLFWGGWKPTCALLGVLISFILLGDSLAPLIAAAAFLLVYNYRHLWIRWWGLKTGYHLGDGVLRALDNRPFPRLQKQVPTEGAILLGLVSGAVLATGTSLSPWAAVTAIAGGLWAWVGNRLRFGAPLVVGIALAVMLVAVCIF
jgi:PTS system mannose-specific IID component